MDAARSGLHRSLVAETGCIDPAPNDTRNCSGAWRQLKLHLQSATELDQIVIARNARLILLTDVTIVTSNIVSSLIGARALGPAGRGDLLVVVLWPPIIAMLIGLGLPTAYRYWMAKAPERV